MKKQSFSYRFTTPQSPEKVFERLQNIPQWWSGLFNETIEGKSAKTNDEFTFSAGEGMHFSRQKLVELVPNRKIAWQVTDSKLTFLENTSEWNGTQLQFDLSSDGKITTVTFTHDGLVPQMECYGNCSSAWTGYLEKLEKALS